MRSLLLALALVACGQVEPEPSVEQRDASAATSRASQSSSTRSSSSTSGSSSSAADVDGGHDAGRDAFALTDAQETLCDWCWHHLLDGSTYCELQLDGGGDPDAGIVPCPPLGSP